MTQLGYEMQWTVRYFSYMSRKWAIPNNIQTMPGTNIGPGPITGPGMDTGMDTGMTTGTMYNTGNTATMTDGSMAYHRRKKAIWEEIMIKADRIFARSNIAYQSPL